MKHRTTRWRAFVATASAAVCLAAAGCSDDPATDSASPDDGGSVSVEPLSGVESPETSAPPAGSVIPSTSGLRSIAFDESTRSVLALDDEATSVLVFDADDLDSAPRVVALPAVASDIVTTGDGAALVPMQGELGRLDLRSVDLGPVDIGPLSAEDTLTSAAVLDDGSIAVGDESGSIHILDTDTNESRTVTGLSSVDALAATEYGLSALDRRQTSLTQVDVDDDSLGIALRAGTGAAELVTDRFGRILVTDAAGGELLVYSSDDLLLRQRFPVGAQPWGIAYDGRSDLVWVTTPGDNQVVGYTLDTGIPVEAERFATVKQPDSVAVDGDAGVLYVGSADGKGLQRIPVGDD